MQVSEVMHKGIVTVGPDETIKRVAELMKSEDIGAIPVCEGDKPVGFITDRDIVVKCVSGDYDLSQAPVKNAMTKEVYTVNEDDSVEKVALLMEQKQVSRVLVVDKDKKPCGMVSLHDLSQSDEDLSEEALEGIKEDQGGFSAGIQGSP